MSALPYPQPSDRHVSARMRRNPRRDTRPEIRLRSLLHRSGLRFRKDFPVRAGDRLIRPDIVFTRVRLAVFVDGCFWHCCPLHGNKPRRNTSYWLPKLERNVARDQVVNAALSQEGWNVIRIWEHEDPAEAAPAIATVVRNFRSR
jgi:DNA mismatch endonuclease (patch repair protein)